MDYLMSGRPHQNHLYYHLQDKYFPPRSDVSFRKTDEKYEKKVIVQTSFSGFDEMKSFDIIFRIFPFMMVNLFNVVFAFTCLKGTKLKGS